MDSIVRETFLRMRTPSFEPAPDKSMLTGCPDAMDMISRSLIRLHTGTLANPKSFSADWYPIYCLFPKHTRKMQWVAAICGAGSNRKSQLSGGKAMLSRKGIGLGLGLLVAGLGMGNPAYAGHPHDRHAHHCHPQSRSAHYGYAPQVRIAYPQHGMVVPNYPYARPTVGRPTVIRQGYGNYGNPQFGYGGFNSGFNGGYGGGYGGRYGAVYPQNNGYRTGGWPVGPSFGGGGFPMGPSYGGGGGWGVSIYGR
jgi:hypothetical protein